MTKIVNHRNNEKYDVYIGRNSIFGNPFIINRDGTRAEVVAKYKKYFYDRIETDLYFKNKVLALKGKTLGCFCKPLACHGDIIKEWLDEK